LTRRETEILELVAEGLTAPTMAARLFLSPATVRTHFRNIYEKLGVGDRAAAVARAMRLGLIA
jgi:two-component system nitrate/nitrite response regulator NarL